MLPRLLLLLLNGIQADGSCSLVPRLFAWAARRKEEPGTNCTRMRVINGFTHVYFQTYDVFTNGRVLTWRNNGMTTRTLQSPTRMATPHNKYTCRSLWVAAKKRPCLCWCTQNAQSSAPRMTATATDLLHGGLYTYICGATRSSNK